MLIGEVFLMSETKNKILSVEPEPTTKRTVFVIKNSEILPADEGIRGRNTSELHKFFISE